MSQGIRDRLNVCLLLIEQDYQILQQNFVCFSFNILTKAKTTLAPTLICEWKCNSFNVKSYQKNVERENKKKKYTTS